MVDERAIWVGMLDFDLAEPIVGISGILQPYHSRARVLIRMHHAPLGHVCVPAQPVQTLTARTREAAETSLSDELSQHANCDNSDDEPSRSREWTAKVACPRRFLPYNGTGITIVVCTRDRTKALRECLHAIQQVTYDPIEIMVVDNAPSGGETREAVSALAQGDSRILYTCEPRPGLSIARNHGLARAKYDIVAFTDDDTIVDQGWPKAIVAGFAADPEAACVTGLVASYALETGSERYFDSRYSWGDAFDPCRYDLVAHRHPSRLYPFSAGMFGTGANFAFRRNAMARIGGFDPMLGAGSPGRGGEDLDMFLRVILAGSRICYVPSALVWHSHRADSQALGEQIYSYGHGLGAYLAKHLLNRQMPAALLGPGIRQAGVVVRRMRTATHESQPYSSGGRLGLSEARGAMAGALFYYRASRRASGSHSGLP